MAETPYHLRHFRELSAHVESQCPWLAETEEGAFLQQLRAGSEDAQSLFLRLANRVPTLFRTDKIAYEDIDLKQACEQLIASGLAQVPTTFREEFLSLFTVPELKKLVPTEAKPKAKSAKRAAWVEAALNSEHACEQVMQHDLIEQLGTWEYGKLLFLYFGNAFQNLSEFVVHEIGHVRVEARPIASTRGRFASRAEADDGWLLECIKMGVWVAAEEQRDAAAALALWQEWRSEPRTLNAFTRRRESKMANRVGRALERAKHDEQALLIYAESELPPARERRARVLKRLGRLDESIALATQILEDGTPEQQQWGRDWIARHTRSRVAGARSQHAPVAGSTSGVRRISREATRMLKGAPVLEVPAGEGSIESRAAQALMATGRVRAWHVENHLWNALFGLVMWDVVFDAEAGFANPHQAVPEALWTPAFFAQRAEAVDAAIAAFTAESVLERWQQKQGTWTPFTNWSAYVHEALSACLSAVPREVLAEICRSMAANPRMARRGFPDLFVVEDAEESVGTQPVCARGIEIKGPGDNLSDAQVVWLRQLNALGFHAEVLRVRPATP